MGRFKHPLIWFIPIIILTISFFPVPFGIYALIRLIVTVAAVYLTYLDYKKNGKITGYFVVFVVIALLFNPVIKIYFSRALWHIFDFIAILFFFIHFLRFYKR
ncbi:MAG: hypothetical protein PVG30_00665 [Gammaproteobacteria bacterium]|jgi:hypothetical protein